MELGPGPGGDMAAKMSKKKKAGGGGGKRKEKLENMKKEMEIVSAGLCGGPGLGLVRTGGRQAVRPKSKCSAPHHTERPPAVSG